MNAANKIKRKTAAPTRKTASNEITLTKTLRASLLGLLVAVSVSFLLLLLGTAAAYSTADPTSLIKPISYTALLLSCIFGGFASAKLNGRSPYITCALSSGAFVLLGLLVSAAIPQSNDSMGSPVTALFLRIAEIFVFFIGAMLGLKAKASHPKKKKKSLK